MNVNLGLSKRLIVARGGQVALTKLCKQLAWPRAALRQYIVPSGLCLSTVTATGGGHIGPSSQLPSMTVHLNFTVTPIVNHISSIGPCWHALFSNAVVVDSFPILVRYVNG